MSKDQIIAAISELTDRECREVIEAARRRLESVKHSQSDQRPAEGEDPLLKAIGTLPVGPSLSSREIDEVLYGDDPA